jgi:hypothetical protein
MGIADNNPGRFNAGKAFNKSRVGTGAFARPAERSEAQGLCRRVPTSHPLAKSAKASANPPPTD